MRAYDIAAKYWPDAHVDANLWITTPLILRFYGVYFFFCQYSGLLSVIRH